MAFNREIESFIKVFVKDLQENNVALFAGAGMSKASGHVDWPELLRDIASEIGLKVELEHDLISLAQFHVNERGGSDGVARKILQEFSEQAEPSKTHQIVARLPIRTYWTTNYDTLIEDALRKAYKVADVKHSPEQLSHVTPKRDAVVYKMHGDVTFPQKAILYKQQYERYHQTHERFITALSGDLVSKTFLFMGFSFSDPNLDYVLSRLHVGGGSAQKTHYSFMRKEKPRKREKRDAAAYRYRKQELRVADLKRFGIQTLLIDEYDQIPEILQEIENRFRKKTVFISGSAEEFGSWERNEAQHFVHSLASELIRNDLRVVNGFGWGIGSAVINGALEAIYANPEKYSEDQLVMRPFPQFSADPSELPNLWEQYRHRMIGLAGVAIFLFGNKPGEDGQVVEANGVIREFEISLEHGLIPIPIGLTEFAARTVWNKIQEEPKKYYNGLPWLPALIKELDTTSTSRADITTKVAHIISRLNK